MTIPPKGSYPIKYFLRKGYLQIKKVQFNAQDGRHVDGPPSLFGWSGIPSLEKISIDIQIVLTERGAGGVKGVEVIKVMHQKGDMVVSLGHPLHKVCYTCEDIWSSPDAERREHIDIKSTTQFHT